MRGLGIVRGNGWIGGVCGGIAARLGIDPLIVRGIAVVIAVLGGPAFLLYAAGWLLLPDTQGDIHLERMIKGRLEPALIGIVVIVLFSLLPFAQGFWWAGAQFWGGGSLVGALGRTLWTLLIIALIVTLVIWAARTGRFSSRGGSTSSRTASVSAATPGTSSERDAAGTDTAGTGSAATGATATSAVAGQPSWFAGTPAQGYGAAPTVGEPLAPTAPPASATPDELAAWRARQDAWKAEHAAWRTQQAADELAIRQQRSAENRARAEGMAAQATEARRLRRLAKPRTSAGYVGITLGVGLLAGGAAAAIALGSPGVSRFALTVGLAVATVAMGLAIVVAGAVRRRSGFLSFIAIVLVAASVLCALLTPPRGRELVLGYASTSRLSDLAVYEPLGGYSIFLDPRLDQAQPDGRTRTIRVEQGIGAVIVSVGAGLTVRVVATQQNPDSSFAALTFGQNGDVTVDSPLGRTLSDGGDRTEITYGDATTPDAVVYITQSLGRVEVHHDLASAPPVPVPAPTESVPAVPSRAPSSVPSSTPSK
jgi:Putative stress-responsive transcriptional regulator